LVVNKYQKQANEVTRVFEETTNMAAEELSIQMYNDKQFKDTLSSVASLNSDYYKHLELNLNNTSNI
jgi:hypothetical protein